MKRKGRTTRPAHNGRLFDRKYEWPLLGIDEVGTGAIAGPIVVAGVVLPVDGPILDALVEMRLRDSKLMGEAARERVSEFLISQGVKHWVFWKHPIDIERVGHYASIAEGIDYLISAYQNEFGIDAKVIIDGQRNYRAAVRGDITYISKGDVKSLTIAAASVIAKVARDRFMKELALDYPGYGFEKHAGYSTKEHHEALKKLGVTDAHRAYTEPIKKLIAARRSHPSEPLSTDVPSEASEGDDPTSDHWRDGPPERPPASVLASRIRSRR